MKIEELKERLVDLNNQAHDIKQAAEADSRDLSVEETENLDGILAAFDRTQADLDRLERLSKQTADLTASSRKTSPSQPTELEDDGQGNVQIKRPENRQLNIRAVDTYGPKNFGFRSLGDMAHSVVRDAVTGDRDPRLQRLAASTYSNEGSGADGGFAVPPDFRAQIMKKVMGEDSLVGRCMQVNTASKSVSLPKDETTPWQTTGGVQAYWQGEGATITESKVALEQSTCSINKVTALVKATDELLEDAPLMDSYLRMKVPEKLGFKVNLAIVQGTGVGQPLGILNSPGLVSVADESSQVADTLIGANVIKMYSRMWAPHRANAVWLINQDIEPQLLKLSLPGTDNDGNAVTGWGGLVYMPPGGLSGAPYGTLFGRPVIPTQACETLGDQGDIIFADLSQYLVALRSGENPMTDVSIHFHFDQHITSFRFTLRIGGMPLWSSTISGRDGAPTTYSPFVTLDART
jgi:HK97 family phage major capsid protein